MPEYIVSGRITHSAIWTIEAESPEKARALVNGHLVVPDEGFPETIDWDAESVKEAE